ncbi:hypothetical protein J6590_005952 [Homalodisca vitripennis]|nr:hypothetical protein J6590_005952 [Homalodisca vitripennis]
MNSGNTGGPDRRRGPAAVGNTGDWFGGLSIRKEILSIPRQPEDIWLDYSVIGFNGAQPHPRGGHVPIATLCTVNTRLAVVWCCVETKLTELSLLTRSVNNLVNVSSGKCTLPTPICVDKPA